MALRMEFSWVAYRNMEPLSLVTDGSVRLNDIMGEVEQHLFIRTHSLIVNLAVHLRPEAIWVNICLTSYVLPKRLKHLVITRSKCHL